jgi:hypothetical protein
LASLQFAVEAIDLAFDIDNAGLLTSEERVAFRANFGSNDLAGRASRPGIAAGTSDLGFGEKGWVNTLLHLRSILSKDYACIRQLLK